MSQYTHPETLVDTQWLSEHLADPNICIIEMDLNSQLYDSGHIPGSILWDASKLQKPDFSINLDPNAIEALLSNSGVGKDTTIVAVHGSFAATSGFIVWLLKLCGHTDVRILNGGRSKWIEDGYPLTTETTIVTPTKYQVKSLDASLRISLAEVQKSIDKSDLEGICSAASPVSANIDRVLLDVRTPQEYSGELFMTNPPTENERGGHIPSAVNLYYEFAHNDDGTFKSGAELEQIFREKGITPDKLIIPYCAVGARSGHIWFILKYLLGYPKVQNYDGSWNEWSRRSELPIEK